MGNNEAGFPFGDRVIASTLDRVLSQTADRELDSNVVDNLYRSIQFLLNAHPRRSLFLAGMGEIYLTRFHNFQCQDALNKAVDIFQEAMLNAPWNDTQIHTYAEQYGILLRHRFEKTGLEEAVRLTPYGHPDKNSILNGLGISLSLRFRHLGDVSDMNKSVSVFEEAVRLTPDGHPDKNSILNNLGNSLSRRFKRLGNLSDIDNSLSRRFEHLGLGDLSDVNKSVSTEEEAVRLTPDGHSDKPSMLNNLGNSLLDRFERLGDLSDVNKSTWVIEEAVRLTPDCHPVKPSLLNTLGNTLSRRFERLGNLSDIDKSVLVIEEAVRLSPDGHPDKPSFLINLGSSLSNRFEHLGDLSNINKSVSVKEEAHLGDLSDMNKSVSVKEEAVRLTPDGHSDKPSWLSNLGTSLLRRFERFGDLNDINKSVSVKEEAVRLTPDGHPNKPSLLSSLGNSLSDRFGHLGDLNDINKSISMKEEAIRLTPDGHPEKPLDVTDINKSVSVLEEAVRLIPNGHPGKPSLLNNLGNSLLHRFEHLRGLSDMEMAGSMFEDAAKSPTGPCSIRFHACFRWAMCCQLYHPRSSLDAYHRAFELLPNMSWLGLSVTDRQHFLKGVGPLVDEAVSAAIDAGQLETAVEWMDQGHSVIWGQPLQLRTLVDGLKERHPDVANRFTVLSKKLEGASTRHNFEATSNNLPHPPVSISENYHELVHERDQFLRHIRGLDGFDRFLLPQTFSHLQTAARNGPVVCINVSKRHSDALILMPGLDDILHVPLEKFTCKIAEVLYGQLRRLLGRNGRNISNDVAPDVRKPRNDIHLNYLSAESVLERLLSQASTVRDDDAGSTSTTLAIPRQHSSEQQSEDELVRVWWFTSGFLTLLLIHAAGIYGEKAFPRSKLSDFVVSSYTPTLSSIITSCPTTLPNPQVLAVALPVESRLPGSGKELDCIVNRVGSSKVKKLVESEATLDNVIAGLEESSFVHFACHGVQNAMNPNESALLLAKSSRLTLSRLHRLSLPYALLAFLSACQTAAGDETLVQESVHLAAGMLSVGYRGVIATMWSIMDSDAPVVADDVYAQLFENSEPDPTLAARALDKAVKKLIKDSNGAKSFLEWVPFIHIGI